jgi:hypothetical protein
VEESLMITAMPVIFRLADIAIAAIGKIKNKR